MIALDMRTLLTALALTAAVAFIACGDDDGGSDAPPTAEGPTEILLDKAFASNQGVFTFTVQVTNTGENDAVLFELSDVWEEGIAVESVGDFEGTMVEPIAESGFEAQLNVFEAGTTRDITYRARCVQSGQWTNTATVSGDNFESVTSSVSISCP